MAKIKIDDLNEVDYNPRIIKPDEFERLKVSIKEYTDTIPKKQRGNGYRLITTVTINKQGNRIIGGHQRIKALKELGQDWIDSSDITWVDIEPDSAKEKALNISLNSEKFSGKWDTKKLDKLIEDIKTEDIDLLNKLTLIEVDAPEIEEVKIEKPKKEPKKVVEKTEIEEVEEDEVEYDEEYVTNDNIPDQQLFPISYAVTSEQRKTILEATTVIKTKLELKSNTEAIVKICELYLNGKN